MPGMDRVEDSLGHGNPLRIWLRKGRGRMSPRVRIKCGCCDEVLDIHPDDPATGDPNLDTLEINGVMGTVDQWKQVLLPLLGVKG